MGISADGVSEVIRQSFAIPAAGDPSRATVEDVSDGVIVNIPQRSRATTASQVGPRVRNAQSAGTAGEHRESASEVVKPQRAEAATAASENGQTAAVVQVSRHPLVLPSSEGVVVLDEPWPEIEKNEDAAEGWW